MSKLTPTERQLVATHRQQSGRPSFKKYFVGDNASGWWWITEFLAIVSGVPGAATMPSWFIAVPIDVMSIPVLATVVALIAWSVEMRHQRNKLRQRYLGWHKDPQEYSKLHKLYHEEVGKRGPVSMREELAEICGQITIRYIQLELEFATSSGEVQRWLRIDSAQAERLAQAIIAYDEQVKQIADYPRIRTEEALAEEKKREEKILADQIASNRRIRREAALKQFREEENARAKLTDKGIDPNQDMINALEKNTQRIKRARAEQEC